MIHLWGFTVTPDLIVGFVLGVGFTLALELVIQVVGRIPSSMLRR